MKKPYFKILLFTICIFSKKALFSQIYFEGNKILSPYYGFPNFGAFMLPNSEINGLNSNYKSIGPLGIRAEYMVSNNIGLGFDFIYNSYKLSFTRETTVYYGNTDQWLSEYTQVEKQMKRIRFQFRYNYHFQVDNPNIDWYGGAGIGSNTRFYKNSENGQEIISSQNSSLENNSTINTSNNVFPVSLRLFGGFNYYFNSRICMGFELGLGGPLLSTSITYKLY